MLVNLTVFVRMVLALGLSAMSIFAVSDTLRVAAVPSALAAPIPLAAPIEVVSGLRVLRSDAAGVLLELTTPAYTFVPVQSEGRAFESLSVTGLNFTAEAGQPQLPMASALLGVPPDAAVTVRVIADDGQLLPGRHDLIPAASPVPLTDDLQPGQTRRTVDAQAYASPAAYPALAARLADDAWLRDQHLVRVEVYPFQYRPRDGQVIWHHTLRVEVTFTRSAARSFKAAQADSGPFDAVLRGSLLNYDQARAWRAEPIGAPRAAPAALAPGYKIVVDHDGVYRVTYADLLAAGLDVTSTVPGDFHLTSQRHEVAIEVTGEADGRFDPGDAIVFYGQKLRGDILAARYAHESDNWLTFSNGWQPTFNTQMVELYTDDNVYWLTTDGAPGPRMDTSNGTPSGTASIPEYYTATVHAEKVNLWSTIIFSSVDTFYWSRLNSASPTQAYTTTLSAVANAPVSATVRAEIAPYTASSHRVQLSVNTPPNLLADVSWSGLVRRRIMGSVPQAQLTAGPFTLTLTTVNGDTLYFDWFEVDYARRFEAQANQLAFSADQHGPREYRVSQLLTGTVTVLDITDPLLPRRVLSPAITSSGGLFTATFEVSPTAPVTYFVAGADQFQSPKAISYYAPPDLSGGVGADYVIIAHRDFITAVQVLADYRSAQGLRTRVIDVDDIYNQYNDGIYHPIAIKNFLHDAYAYWPKPAPTYAVLVGDGHWNFKGYSIPNYGTPANTPIYMPPNLNWVDPWQGEVDSSSYLAAVSGDDILPDLAIGRILVNSVAELNTVISKTIGYEQAGILPYQSRATFVADNIPDGAGDFVASSEAAISYLPKAYAVDRIYQNDLHCTSSPCPWVNYALTTTLNLTGALFVNYTGHGSLNRWSGESIFVNADVPTLTNTRQLPILLSMTCLDGYWSHPNTNTSSSLVELNVRAANGGAVAAFSPTGLGTTNGHDSLDAGFLTAVFTDGVQQLGPAALAAKLRLFAAGGNFDLIHTFTTFGDPALKLPTYALTLTPAADTHAGLNGQVVTYTLRVTNSAFMTDVVNFSAAGQTWPISLPSALTLPPGASAEAVVAVTVPLTAAMGRAEIVTVTAQSKGDATRASAVLTTQFYRQVLAMSQTQAGNPGDVLTYRFMLSDTGSLTDALNLSTSGQSWPVALSAASAVLPPATSVTLTTQVTIPLTAWAGEIDRGQVQAQSNQSGLISTVNFTSTVNVVYSSTLSPANVVSAGLPGQAVAYPFQLFNSGNISQTFEVTGDSVWPLVIAPDVIGPLSPGSAASFTVTTTVPIAAMNSATATITATAQSGLLAPLVAHLTTSSTVRHGVSLAAQPPVLTANPGAAAASAISLTNTGNVYETFTLNPLAGVWPITLSTHSLLVLPGATGVAWLTVTVPPSALANDFAVAQLVGVSSGGEVSATLAVTTTAKAVYGVSLAAQPPVLTANPGAAATSAISLTNTGNVYETFTLNPLAGVWPITLSTHSLLVMPGATGVAWLTVTVPPSALANDLDVTQLVGLSSGGEVSATLAVTTTAKAVYGVTLAAQPPVLTANPGAAATSMISLTNTGNVYETFTLNPLAGVWPITLSTHSLLVLPGATGVAWLTVTVPPQTLADHFAVTQLVGVSSGGEVSATLAVTTTAKAVYGVTLAPSSLTATGRPGELFTYTLRLTNTGNITTSFQLLSHGPWASTVSSVTLGPLPALAGQDFNVYVQAPAAAAGQSTTVVTATAQGGSRPFVTAALVTKVEPYRIYLPLVRRDT